MKQGRCFRGCTYGAPSAGRRSAPGHRPARALSPQEMKEIKGGWCQCEIFDCYENPCDCSCVCEGNGCECCPFYQECDGYYTCGAGGCCAAADGDCQWCPIGGSAGCSNLGCSQENCGGNCPGGGTCERCSNGGLVDCTGAEDCTCTDPSCSCPPHCSTDPIKQPCGGVEYCYCFTDHDGNEESRRCERSTQPHCKNSSCHNCDSDADCDCACNDKTSRCTCGIGCTDSTNEGLASCTCGDPDCFNRCEGGSFSHGGETYYCGIDYYNHPTPLPAVYGCTGSGGPVCCGGCDHLGARLCPCDGDDEAPGCFCTSVWGSCRCNGSTAWWKLVYEDCNTYNCYEHCTTRSTELCKAEDSRNVVCACSGSCGDCVPSNGSCPKCDGAVGSACPSGTDCPTRQFLFHR